MLLTENHYIKYKIFNRRVRKIVFKKNHQEMKKINIFYLFTFLFLQSVIAQKETDSLALNLIPTFGSAPFTLNKSYISSANDTLQISLFKFYISGLQIEFNDGTILANKNSYHLIDVENLKSLQIPLCKKNGKVINRILFNIGIDSTSSVSGALGGDLDPTKGMYWAWQSGYINIKIEGVSSSCKTRRNEFQFHIGGYLHPFYALRKVELKPLSQNLDIIVDVSEIFNSIQLSYSNSIMIPGIKAMELANYSIKMFKIE